MLYLVVLFGVHDKEGQAIDLGMLHFLGRPPFASLFYTANAVFIAIGSEIEMILCVITFTIWSGIAYRMLSSPALNLLCGSEAPRL